VIGLIAMVQLILRYTGAGPTPADDLQRLRALDHSRILEQTGRMVLLETPNQQVDSLADLFPGWISAPVRHDIEVPDPNPKPKGRN
jgi:hypothetical protein